MSRINGEKARAAIAKRNRTARREKDRQHLEQLRGGKKAEKPDAERERTSDR